MRIALGALILTLAVAGCYTSLKHPTVYTDSRYVSQVQVASNDNCMDCHTAPLNPTVMPLPESAQHDPNWRFYGESSWWQDDYEVGPSPDDYVEPTGPRLGVPPSSSAGAIVAPIGPQGPSLGKIVVEEESKDGEEENDGRRSFERRKESQTGESSSSRRKRRK